MFAPVNREQNKLRLALCGPSGSGKTYTAIMLAHALAGADGRIALIDTEHGSASKYAGTKVDDVTWAWDHLSLDHYAPARYIDAIRAASEGEYDVLIIDSLSHAWAGTGGALDQVDHSRDSNKFGAWRNVTPQHNALVEAILSCRCHVIATMRSKTEYVLEADARGKQVPRKVGTKPVQRDGVEYEFDIVIDLDHQHTLTVSKTRCPAVDGDIVNRPSGAWIEPVRAWLYDGAAPSTRPKPQPKPAPQSVEHDEAPPAEAARAAPSGTNGDMAPNKGGAWTEEHQRLADAIMFMAHKDKEVAGNMCKAYSQFETKDGKKVSCRSVGDMSVRWVRTTWKKVRPEYEIAKNEGDAEKPDGFDPEEEAAIESTRVDRDDGNELPF